MTESKRGRPALGVELTTVRLSGLAKTRIEAIVGRRGMAQFIREAIERELERREQVAPKKTTRKR